MVKITEEAALAYHANGRPGKIEVKPTKPYRTSPIRAFRYRKILMMSINIQTRATL